MKTIQLTHTRVFKTFWESVGDTKPHPLKAFPARTLKWRIHAFRGGARSSKTWSVLQAICYWLMTGYLGKLHVPSGNFSIVRETLPALRATAYKDFIEILHQCGFYEKTDHKKTLLEFHFNGREVNFFSTDDINSSRLRGRQHSFFYMNEANTISREAWNQLIMRTEYFAVLDYNPSGIDSWVKSYIEETRIEAGDCKLDVSTYFDNIKHLPQEMVDEIENYKLTDFELYSVYAKGQWVKSRNLVFGSINIIKKMPIDYDRENFGIDFGFNDPTVIIRTLVKGKNLYIEQILYKSKMGIQAIADVIKANLIQKVFCDHSPLLRAELKAKGVNIRDAKKGKDSIFQGNLHIRGYKIHILETSLETINDFRRYKYRLDENNNPTDELFDGWDHAPDATRYSLSWIKRKTVSFGKTITFNG